MTTQSPTLSYESLAGAVLLVHAVEELGAEVAVAGLENHEVGAALVPHRGRHHGQLAVGGVEADLGLASLDLDRLAEAFGNRLAYDRQFAFGEIRGLHLLERVSGVGPAGLGGSERRSSGPLFPASRARGVRRIIRRGAGR
ncbi:MAG: hypothetical protein MZV65_29800 [Chromatiales bacterium]|nr:hypothetical protein [Chromatiales bacterium]